MTRLTVNNQPIRYVLSPDTPLAYALRDASNLTGTKIGCATGECGACTVDIDGRAVRSCTVTIAQVEGSFVTTIEGLARDRDHPVQQAFLAANVSQCGYCIPGIVMSAASLLRRERDPSEESIRTAVDHHCRCGIQPRLVDAVRRAAALARGDETIDPVAPYMGFMDALHLEAAFGGHGKMTRNWFLAMAAATALWPVGAMAQDRTIRRAESQREAGNLRGAELREALRNRPQQERGRGDDFGRDRRERFEARDNVRRESRAERRDWASERRDAHQQDRPDRRDWVSERGLDRRDDARERPGWQRERYRRSQWNDGDRRWNGDGDRRRRDWFVGDRDRRGYADDRWNRDWRRDGRYDWRGYRQSNRSIYRLPRYYAPHDYFGGYRRFGIGLTIGSSLFGQDYWLDDPWTYRLPPVDGPYRWVRYYNDALLVDLDTGEVVDVEYDIFW